jgi:hypothetical protein
MNSQPRSKGEDANYRMMVGTNLGNRSVSADHRHNTFVQIFEWFLFFAFGCGSDVLCAMASGLLRNGSELKQWLACSIVEIREISQGVHAWIIGDRQIGLYVDAPAMTRLDS